MCYVHSQWYDISCATLYVYLDHWSIFILIKIRDMNSPAMVGPYATLP